MRTMGMLLMLALMPSASMAQDVGLRPELVGLASRIASATDSLKTSTSSLGGRLWNRLDPGTRPSALTRLDDRAEELLDATRGLRSSDLRKVLGLSRSRHERVARFNRALDDVRTLVGDAERDLRRRGDRRLQQLFERDVSAPLQRMERLAPRLSVARPQDTVLERDIHATFAGDPRLQDDRIGVSVRDGVAELTGSVDGAYERERAERRAREVPGVVRVRNRLRVRTARTQGVG